MNCRVLQQFFKRIRPSYRPPSAYKLAHNLLDTISDQVDKENSTIIDKGINLTVLVDGWTDVTNASLVNVAVFAGSPIFLKSIAPGANRHDAELIAKTILDVIEKTPADLKTVTNKSKGQDDIQTVQYVDERKFRSVVTDQPAVMTAAWKIIECAKPWVHCYGCGAHVINLLAGDIGKIPEISSELDNNRKISVIFRSRSMCKEVLQETTLNKYSKSLNVVLSCKMRWSTDYFMVARNLRLKDALICACVDPRLTKEMRNSDVKTLILSDSDAPGDFWKATERVFHVLKPLKTAIQFCEGDDVPLSVMPRIWQFIANQLDISLLCMLGFNDVTANAVTEAVTARRDMNLKAITLAAYVLDPRFHGEGLTESEWSDACEVVVSIADHEKLIRSSVLGDLAEYRSKSGTVFGSDLVWEAALSEVCCDNPSIWWSSYASTRELSKVASILLSMPATAATIERCNKSYSLAKTKERNRLSRSRASALARLTYNLSIKKAREVKLASTKRSDRRRKRCHILALPVGTVATSSESASGMEVDLSNDQPRLPELDSASDDPEADDFEADNNNEQSDAECRESSEADTSSEHTDAECGEHSDNNSDAELALSDTDEEDSLAGFPVSLLTGDWVAVRVEEAPLCEKWKTNRLKRNQYLHVARIDNIHDDRFFTVSFLKRQKTDSKGAWYTWPEQEDISTVERDELVKLIEPYQDIVSAAGSVVRIKLHFDSSDIDNARTVLDVPIRNVR